MIDALSHLPLFTSPGEAAAYLESSARDGVTDAICAGTEPRRDANARYRDVSSPRIHRAFGIHPEHARDDERDAQLSALQRALDAAPDAVAVGELGLDHRDGQPPLDVQERTLRAQLAIARARRMPVILHLVGSWSRALDVIEEDGALADADSGLGGIWHAFAGPKEAIGRAAKLGLAFSVGGLVLNEHSRRLHEALPHVPDALLVVESDMPHTPPLRLSDVVDEVARIRGVTRAAIEELTTANARRVFRLR